MPPEKSEFELELRAQIIEFGHDTENGLQGAITFVVKERLAALKSSEERKILQLEITEALVISKAQEAEILKKIGIGIAPGKYYFSYDFGDE